LASSVTVVAASRMSVSWPESFTVEEKPPTLAPTRQRLRGRAAPPPPLPSSPLPSQVWMPVAPTGGERPQASATRVTSSADAEAATEAAPAKTARNRRRAIPHSTPKRTGGFARKRALDQATGQAQIVVT
jgi:hypothetical protein